MGESLEAAVSKMKYKNSWMAGISGPMGYFDPLGFSTTVDAGKLLFYREVELKHGRVAMLASLGMLVGEQFHPLFGGGINVPAAFAFQETPLQAFWPAVVAAIAIPEVYSVFTFREPGLASADQWTIREDHEPGNLGFDPLGLKPTDPKELKEMQTKELNNGRLAMIAAAGMIAQELATGKTPSRCDRLVTVSFFVFSVASFLASLLDTCCRLPASSISLAAASVAALCVSLQLMLHPSVQLKCGRFVA